MWCRLPNPDSDTFEHALEHKSASPRLTTYANETKRVSSGGAYWPGAHLGVSAKSYSNVYTRCCTLRCNLPGGIVGDPPHYWHEDSGFISHRVHTCYTHPCRIVVMSNVDRQKAKES